MSVYSPEVRITRITETYLQDTLDEMAEEQKKPKGPTKAEKKQMKKEAARQKKMEEQSLILRVSRIGLQSISPCLCFLSLSFSLSPSYTSLTNRFPLLAWLAH